MPKQASVPSHPFMLSSAIFLSGVCWLVFELVWSRYLTLIFGASVFAVTSVLACFMLGMALGSWLLGRRADTFENSEQLLIWLNIIIGLYGLLSPLIFMGISRLNVLIFSNLDTGIYFKNSFRFLLSFLVLIVPTFAMGGTFPLMIKLITRRIEAVGKDTSYVYWVNTLGGALGAFVSGFLLIRILGLSTTTVLASLANLSVAGLVFLYLRTADSKEKKPARQGKPAEKRTRDRAQDETPVYPAKIRSLILIVFALSGFTSLAYEVFFTRVLTLFFRDSVYDFAIVLTTFLVGLGLGSLICGRVIERSRRLLLILAGVEGLVGFFSILSLGLINQLPYVAGYLQSMPTLYNQYGAGDWTAVTGIKFGYAFGALLLPTSLLGMTFPLVSKIWVSDIDRLGKDIGIISVDEVIPLQIKVLTTNRLYSQNTSVMTGLEDHRRLGYIPLLLHPKPRKVLVIGLGAGITLRGVSEVPGLKSIDCVEISEGVKQAPQYFSVENNHILENPKINFVIEDGGNFISTSGQTYDVIIADIFFPMSSGSSALFSREHFEASKAHLSPGGLMVQWLPAHQLSMAEIKIITRTFKSVFPHTSIWNGMIGDATPAIGLVGTDQKLEIDLFVLEATYKDPGFARNLKETNLDDPFIFLSNFILEEDSVRTLTESQPINTDDHPIIEFTNPLVYENFTNRGRDNLLSFNELTEDVLPYVKFTGREALDVDAIRARLDRIRLEIRDILLNSN